MTVVDTLIRGLPELTFLVVICWCLAEWPRYSFPAPLECVSIVVFCAALLMAWLTMRCSERNVDVKCSKVGVLEMLREISHKMGQKQRVIFCYFLQTASRIYMSRCAYEVSSSIKFEFIRLIVLLFSQLTA